MVLLVDALAEVYLPEMPFLSHLTEAGAAYSVRPAPGFRGVEPILNGVWTLPEEVPFRFRRGRTPTRFPPCLGIGDSLLPRSVNRLARFALATLTRRPYPHLVPAGLLTRLEVATGTTRVPMLIEDWERRGLDVWWYTRDSAYERRKALSARVYRLLHGKSLLREVLAALRAGKDVVYLEFSVELDRAGHAFGPTSEQTRRRARMLDHELAEWMERVWRVRPGIEVAILSDHGMSAVTSTLDLETLLAQRGLLNGPDYQAVWNSNFGQIWADPNSLGRIHEVLGEARGVTAVDTAAREDWFGAESAYGDLIVACEEGTVFSPNHFQGAAPVRGMHGYLRSETVESRALCILSGPGFRQLPERGVDMPDLYPALAKWGVG